MTTAPQKTYTIWVEPEGPFPDYIETSTDCLGHALLILDELGEAPGIAAQGQKYCYADGDILRIQDEDDRVLKAWSREKGVISEDLDGCDDIDVIGWQILNADGINIHGDSDDPFDLTSFAILVGDAAQSARRWTEATPGYTVGPVRNGDIEEPEFVSSVTLRAPTPR